MFQIIYGKKAIKFLKKQDKPTQKCLMTAISRLPLEGDIKKLQGASGYRLRVGNFQVLFDVNGVIINPWNRTIMLDKELIRIILQQA